MPSQAGWTQYVGLAQNALVDVARFRLGAAVVVLGTLLTGCVTGNEHYDLIIRGGLVYDGTTAAATIANIGINDSLIETLNAGSADTATRIIDAHGLIVTPGFIDPHTHALATLLEPATRASPNYLFQGVTTVFVGNDGYGLPERDARLATLEAHGIGPNLAFLSGHGHVRRQVMGQADRPASKRELDAMRELVANDMQAGAFGFSTGLFYAPGSYANVDEVIALARVAADAGGIYDTHLRSESSAGDGLLAAIDEALLIGREANIPVHVSHVKALGSDVWGQSKGIVQRINAARKAGLNVTANQYPWEASGTRFSNAIIPRWVMADSRAKMRERLADPSLQQRLKNEMNNNLRLRGGADAMLVTHANSPYVGMTLAEIAVKLDLPAIDAAVQVVLQGDPSIASFVMQREDIDYLAAQPWVMTGSDGSSGHPRLYASYPKAWQDFVISRKLLSPAQFVHRSSGLVADTFGLCRRGYLRPGYVADITVLDSGRFIPNATYRDPTALSSGVVYLAIGGKLAIDDSKVSAINGRIIRKTDCAER
ncbi:MAG: amidohydrolase family protein [Pseudomonadota bacterium]